MRAPWMFLGLLACSVLSAPAFGQASDEVATVVENIQEGSTVDLARHFADDVNLSLNGEAAHYSRDQAEVVLREFLRHHPVGPATVVRQAGPTGQLRYILARSRSQSRPVRMELVLEKTNGRFSINALQMAQE